MKFFIIILIIFMIVFLCVLALEKYTHKDYTLEAITNQSKQDIGRFVKELFGPIKVRQYIPVEKYEQFRIIILNYSDPAFDIGIGQYANSGTPYFGAAFVPRTGLDEEELISLCKKFHLKFKDILNENQIIWQSFCTYTYDGSRYQIYVYYSEFKEDFQNFRWRFLHTIQERTDKDRGCIYDPDLERELREM